MKLVVYTSRCLGAGTASVVLFPAFIAMDSIRVTAGMATLALVINIIINTSS